MFCVLSVLSLLPLGTVPAQVQSLHPTQPQLLRERRYTGEDTRTPIGHVGTALLGRDSLVYVLDMQNRVIHVAKGATQLRLMSRSGRGPGEMQAPGRMAFLGDSISLPDASLARVTLFPLRGQSFRTVDVTPARAPGFYSVSPVAYGRSALVLAGSNVAGDSKVSGMSNDVGLFLRRHGSAKLDTLAHLIRTNAGMQASAIVRGERVNMPREQPFIVLPTWDYGREGGGVVVLDTAGSSKTTVTVRLRQWGNDGRIMRTCTVVHPLRQLTNEAFEAGLLSVGPPPSARDIVKPDWAEFRRVIVRPAWLPPFRSVRLASDGTVWIRTEASFTSNHEEYQVFPPTGCAISTTVSLPLETTVEDARGTLLITSGYVDDAPTIDTWRLRGRD